MKYLYLYLLKFYLIIKLYFDFSLHYLKIIYKLNEINIKINKKKARNNLIIVKIFKEQLKFKLLTIIYIKF